MYDTQSQIATNQGIAMVRAQASQTRDSLGAECAALHESLSLLEKSVSLIEDTLGPISECAPPQAIDQNGMADPILPPALADIRRARRLVDALNNRIATARNRLAL